MSSNPPEAPPDIVATGIQGLDNVLCGGLTKDRLYLCEGVPGSGKTTLALQFLNEGVRLGESVLYVTLSETNDELEEVAKSHNWSLEGIHIRELVPSEALLNPEEQYTMFHPADVELSETTKSILADVEKFKPTRLVLDSLSELRLLSGNPLRYRRQILALKQFFAGRHCTVILLDDLTATDRDLQVQSISHGVIRLEQLNPEYGGERRRLRIVKYRGVKFRGGYHDYTIVLGGLEVFPRLVAAEHRQPIKPERLSSGLPAFDQLLGGGIERGTSTLIAGAPGTGKSTLAATFAAATAERGKHTAMFIFDELQGTLCKRAEGLGIDLAKHIEGGRITVQQVDPAELSPGEFAHAIRHAVEVNKATVVVIDSLNGYLNAMPNEKFLIIQLHELLSYLGQQGVATVLVAAHQGIIGTQMAAPVDTSYLADSVVLLRYFEAHGEIRQAISVVKKRGGEHERTIREFSLQNHKITVGKTLTEFHGVLTGIPTYVGDAEQLKKREP